MTEMSFKDKLHREVRRTAPQPRDAAARELRSVLRTNRSIEQLWSTVEDQQRSPRARARAVWALRLIDDRTLRARLPKLLEEHSANDAFRWELAKTVVALKPSGVGPTLRRMMAHRAHSTREMAAWIVGFITGASHRAELESMLQKDDDPAVRAQAAESLGTIGSKKSRARLIAALNDPSPRVRYSAAYALGELDDGTALPALRAHQNDRSRVGSETVSDEVTRVIRQLARRRRSSPKRRSAA